MILSITDVGWNVGLSLIVLTSNNNIKLVISTRDLYTTLIKNIVK